jgi:glycosyltransferase involved in cell wall biosynthesis
VPVVITSHGGDVNPANARLSRPTLRERYVQAVQSADTLVAISKFTEDGFLRLGAHPNQIARIPNGVDFAPLTGRLPRPTDLPGEIQPGNYFLFLGRLKRRKGVDLLLEALAQMKANGGGGTPLVITGDGEERAALEAQVRDLALGGQVYFVGRRFADEKNYLLQNALATVVPSRLWEAFGLIVLESYAAGTPVIATRLAGLEDLVEEGRTGCLVAPESASDLAAAMHRLLSSPERARAMGATAKTIVPRYRWPTIAQRHLDLYQRLLSEKIKSKGA